MPANIFEEYRQMLIELGEEARLSEDEKKYQEIIGVIRSVTDDPDDAGTLLRHMVEDMGRGTHPSLAIKEAQEWLCENRVYAWRGSIVALRDWGPHSADEQSQLLDCMNWQVHMAEYKLIQLRDELNQKRRKEQRKGWFSRIFG